MATALMIPAGRAVATWAARAAPEVIEVVARDVTAKSGVLLKTAKQLIAFATSSPAKAAVVVASAASLGYDVYDGLTRLMNTSSPNTKDGVYEADLSGLVDKNSHLELNLGDADDVVLAQDMVAFFRSNFGVRSPEEMQRLHLMWRAFDEMSTAQVKYVSTMYWNTRRAY